MELTAKTAAMILGVILILVGLLGFVWNPILGLFAVNAPHNLVHLITGIALLAGAYSGFGGQMALRIVAIVYVIIAILGFFTSDDMLLGFILNNAADRWLHVVLAIVFLIGGFALPAGDTSKPMM